VADTAPIGRPNWRRVTGFGGANDEWLAADKDDCGGSKRDIWHGVHTRACRLRRVTSDWRPPAASKLEVMRAQLPHHGDFPASSLLVSPARGPMGKLRTQVFFPSGSFFARLCDDLRKSGVHGMTPLGSTGEFGHIQPFLVRSARRWLQTNIEAARAAAVAAGVRLDLDGMRSAGQGDKEARRRRRHSFAILEEYFPLGRAGPNPISRHRRCSRHPRRDLHQYAIQR